MADQTITAVQTGVNEVALSAATPVSVQVSFKGQRNFAVEVIQHGGTKPVYVGRATLAAKAATAIGQVVPNGSKRISVAQGGVIYLVCEATASVSVRKV